MAAKSNTTNAMSDGASGWKETWDDLWEILGCKWTFHIIRLLSMGDHGFNEMKRELEGITATMLSRRLKQLEAAGFVSKTVIASSPPTTSYRLTGIGEELAENLRCIERIDGIDESINE